MRRVLALLSALGFLTFALAVASTVPASAGGADDAPPSIRAELDAGFDGYFVPGRPVPVRVTLTATQLTSGRLAVRLGGNTVEAVEVEVTAGSSEEHWLLLDAPRGDSIQAVAAVTVDGRQRVADSQALDHDRDVQLVGVLPSLGAGRTTDRIPLAVAGQELEVVDLPAALLDLGPEALSALDSLALTPDDVASLSDAHRQTVIGWLVRGGTLYVDGPDGALVDWPDELQPGAAPAGFARVVPTGGALAEGRWADVILPAPNRSIDEDAEAAQNVPGPDLFFEFSGVDLGRDLPPLGGLLTVLGVYIIVVGPVVYLVSRGRVMLRWLAIPAVAGLATAFLAVTGEGLGNDTTMSVVDVIETGPGAAVATSRVLVSAEGGGREIAAPRGWTAENDDFIGFGTEIGQRRRADDVRFSVQIPPGGVGYLAAQGPVAFDGGLDVTAAAAADGTVIGRVTNSTDVALVDVAVFAGRAAQVLVGDLAPGESSEFELTGTDQFRFATRPFADVWADVGFGGSGPAAGMGDDSAETTIAPAPAPPMPPDFMGDIISETCDSNGNCEQCDADGNCFGFQTAPDFVCDEAGNCFEQGFNGCGDPSACARRSVRPESLTAALYDRGSNAMPPGLITAVGWTDQLAPLLDLGSGVDVVDRRTAIVGRAVPEVSGDRLVTSGVVRTLASVGNDENGNIVIVFRFDLPAAVDGRAVDPARLRLDVPVIFTKVSILAPGAETVVRDVQFDEPPPTERLEVAVPPAAVVGERSTGGSVFVAATLPLAPPQPGREMVIYEAAR